MPSLSCPRRPQPRPGQLCHDCLVLVREQLKNKTTKNTTQFDGLFIFCVRVCFSVEFLCDFGNEHDRIWVQNQTDDLSVSGLNTEWRQTYIKVVYVLCWDCKWLHANHYEKVNCL